jgi:hypothetical protein
MGDQWGGFGMSLGCAPLSHNPNPYSLRRTFFIHCMCTCFTSAGISKHWTWLALFLQSEKQWPMVCQCPHMKVPFSLALTFKFNPVKVLHCSPSLNFKSTHWCLLLTPRSGDPSFCSFLISFVSSFFCFLFFFPFLDSVSDSLAATSLKQGGRVPPKLSEDDVSVVLLEVNECIVNVLPFLCMCAIV